VDARVDSLGLAAKLGSDDPATLGALLGVLMRPDNPKKLHYALLEFVLRKGDPAVAEYAVKVLDDRELPIYLRDAVLTWLTVNSRPEVLAQVVKLWGQEESVTSPNEPRYRNIVERLSGRTWQEALVGGINSPGFLARGSAIEILTARVDERDLRRRIMQTAAVTPAMAALREFIQKLDYLPTNKTDFLAATEIYSARGKMLGDVAQICNRWYKQAGYRFVIRDFHLLSRLGRDPLRKEMRRSELVIEISRAVAGRDHVHRQAIAGMPAGTQIDSFASRAPSLSMADLWNLHLLNEMLSSPRVQRALTTMTECDYADKRSAWGGLVLYESGRAEAKLYPAMVQGHGDDLHYVAGQYLEVDGRDALCRFHAHFDKVNNAEKAGPDLDELTQARTGGFYALALTSVDQKTFAAHYYNPVGIVISLGNFPFRGRAE
jgi:hypothetical protein